MNRQQLLHKIKESWTTFNSSYAGLSDAQMIEPGVTDNWSVKDILAHVTIWEEEALKHLPLIVEGRRPPRYSERYGEIDAFNALMIEQRRNLSLAQALRQLDETHRRLIAYVETAPDDQIVRETRFRRRLRLDTYSHYPIHTRMIEEWRGQSAGSRASRPE